MTSLRGRFVGVLGAGRSGVAAARLLRSLGARVLLSEAGTARVPALPGVEIERGGHSKRLLDAELIVRSPGVPGRLPILLRAARRKTPVWSELELAWRQIRPALTVAVTGTNGKTTTTALVGEIFKATGKPTQIGGNIGTPLSELVARIRSRTQLVLEVSSYQLEGIETFHPDISAILNVTPDHLEHHGTMAAYAAAKARIFERQTPQDVCVLNADDAWCRRLSGRCPARVLWFSRRKAVNPGVYLDKQGRVAAAWGEARARWRLESRLPGPHNVENVLAAVAMAVAGGVPVPMIRSVLRRFAGVEHRLETVRSLDGVRYVNDSKATNVDSTRMALLSFSEPLVLIMGGQGKGAPYRPLRRWVKAGVRRLLLIGEDAERIRRELSGAAPCDMLRTMARAVRRARAAARPGEVVLLSPACASFDQYKNYEHRGRHFRELVRRLR